MIRRPPRSTLFPTRRSSDLCTTSVPGRHRRDRRKEATLATTTAETIPAAAGWLDPFLEMWRRSEEHTSELQSRLHLVCRLLLEKKKNKTRSHIIIPMISYKT